MTPQTAPIVTALVVGREGHHLANIMAHQTVFATLQRVGYCRDRRSYFGWSGSGFTWLVAVKASLTRPALVVSRKRHHLSGAMAHQAVLAAFHRVGYRRDPRGYCGWGCCGWSRSNLTWLVAVKARLLRPALVIGWNGLHFASTMAYQAVSPAFNGMGNDRNLRCCDWLGCVHSSNVDLMAVEAKLVGLKRMILRKRLYRTLSMAKQAIVLAFFGVRDCRDALRITNQMALGTGFVGHPLVFFRKVFAPAMTADAIQAAHYRVWHSLALIQSWQAIGGSSQRQQHDGHSKHQQDSHDTHSLILP